jgi:hypothetical protein
LTGIGPIAAELATSLLTNREWLEVDQHSRDTKVAIDSEQTVVWTSKPGHAAGHYVAIFNRAE